MQDHFGRSAAAGILGIPASRLRYWERIGLVKPSLKEGQRVFYDFQDLICLKTARGLIEKGLSASQIKDNIQALRARFPAFEGQLSSKRIYVFGNRIIISDRRRLIDTQSGDLFFKFDVNDFSREIESQLAKIESKSAQEWLDEGSELAADPKTCDRAIQAFQQAAKLDPSRADAYVQMGSLFYGQRKFIDAQRCFRIALRRQPYHAEACFKLGNVLDELNCTEEAVRWYEKAVEIDPEFSNAYFNLATAAEKLSLFDRAIRAWRAYLQFEPRSPQARSVRRRIKEIENHLDRE